MPNILTLMKSNNKENEYTSNKIHNNSNNKDNCKCFNFYHKHLLDKFLKDNNSNNKNNHLLNNFVSHSSDYYHINAQFFHLGYLILISALGEIEFDSLNYIFNNMSNLNISNKSNNNLLQILLSIEESSPLIKKSKIKIQNFINNTNFSDNFLDFISQCLSFTNDNKSYLFNHPWLKVNNYIILNNNLSKVRVNLKELIKITRESKKLSNTHNYSSSVNEKKLLNFLNNFEIILANYRSIRSDDLIKSINCKKFVYKELSAELAINPNDLIKLLQNKVIQNK